MPWQYGHYNLHISKVGAADINSATSTITAGVPLRVRLSGQVKQQLFGQDINIACATEFETQSEMTLTPIFSKALTGQLDIHIPVPETELDCQGLKLPIKTTLEQLIAQEKPQWETQAEAQINQLFRDLGL